MATPSGSSKKKGTTESASSSGGPSKAAEKYFGSEVNLKLQAVINPPQKLTNDEKIPQPAQLTSKKLTKDATQEESLKVLAEKLQNLGKKINLVNLS